MAIQIPVTLKNGVNLNYFVIASFIVKPEEYIEVDLHGFTSQYYFNLASMKKTLLIEQYKKVDLLNNLTSSDNYNENEARELSDSINQLARELSKYRAYDEYVVLKKTYRLPYTNTYSLKEIENSIYELVNKLEKGE